MKMDADDPDTYYALFNKVIFRDNRIYHDCRNAWYNDRECKFVGMAPASVDLEGEISVACPECGQRAYVGDLADIGDQLVEG